MPKESLLDKKNPGTHVKTSKHFPSTTEKGAKGRINRNRRKEAMSEARKRVNRRKSRKLMDGLPEALVRAMGFREG